MKIKLYIFILSLNFGCSGQIENSSSTNEKAPKNEIEIEPKLSSINRNNRFQNLKQFNKVGKSETYEMTKQKIEIQRSQLNSNELKIDSISKFRCWWTS